MNILVMIVLDIDARRFLDGVIENIRLWRDL